LNYWRNIGLAASAVVVLGTNLRVDAAVASGRHGAVRPREELSYRPVGKLIYLPVRINGGAQRWFCVDTGAPESIIDQAAAKEAAIPLLSSGTVQGAGNGRVEADFGPPVRLTIGKLTTTVKHPRIIDLSSVPVPVRPAGLIGAEFFEKYVVRVDTDRHRIAFIDRKSFHHPNAASIPLELTNHRLYVQLQLEPRPGLSALRRVRVDTGSEDSVDDDSVKKSATVAQTRLGNGLGSSYVGYSGVYSSVGIGPYKFGHVWGPAGAIPIIGMEMMRRFTLTFDATKGTLYLEPNRHFDEPVPAPN
jgi:hypothetical protein